MIFSFYINEVVVTILAQTVGCRLAGMSYNIICYTDDITVLAPSKMGLQILLNSLAELLDQLCLKVNISKSCYIVFKRSEVANQFSPVKLLGKSLKMVSECKYLDVVLTETLFIKPDVDRATGSF